MPSKKIDFDVVRVIAMALPDVEESAIHGAPSLKVRGRLLTCPALHASAEPNTLAVRIDFEQRAELMAAEPDVYYVTDHYVNYPTVLVRLSRIDRDSLRDLLGMAWRFVTAKTKRSGPKVRNQANMHKSIVRSAFFAIAVSSAFSLSPTVFAQWLKYPTAGVPKAADGKPNLSARTPRTPDGKPDLSGIWLTDNIFCPQSQNPESLTCGSELPMGKEGINMGQSLPGGLPYQPWLAALVKKRTAENAKDDPHVRCLPDAPLRAYNMPHLLKLVHTPTLLVMLNEMNAGYRQVFIDGRPLPTDPVPSWQGYSSAKWEADTLVVTSIGFRDDLWIDWNGSVLTTAAKVQERIRRPDYGHLEVGVTVDDPKAYTKPWTVTLHERLALNTELVDEICLENEKSAQRMK